MPAACAVRPDWGMIGEGQCRKVGRWRGSLESRCKNFLASTGSLRWMAGESSLATRNLPRSSAHDVMSAGVLATYFLVWCEGHEKWN